MAITAPWGKADDIITVKDLSNTDYASYETLPSNHFPLSSADYSVLVSLPPRDQDDGPVIMAQINFIKGGRVWGIVFDHAYTDGTGAAFVPKVWAAYCRGEDGSKFVTPDIMQFALQMTTSVESLHPIGGRYCPAGRDCRTENFPDRAYCGQPDHMHCRRLLSCLAYRAKPLACTVSEPTTTQSSSLGSQRSTKSEGPNRAKMTERRKCTTSSSISSRSSIQASVDD